MTDQPKTDGLLRPYAIITDKICAMLSQGVIPWRKPWNVENADPVSLASGKQYRGVNVFMLETSAAMSGYRSRYWVTFKQALERGGNVRKGEQAPPGGIGLPPPARCGELLSASTDPSFLRICRFLCPLSTL